MNSELGIRLYDLYKKHLVPLGRYVFLKLRRIFHKIKLYIYPFVDWNVKRFALPFLKDVHVEDIHVHHARIAAKITHYLALLLVFLVCFPYSALIPLLPFIIDFE